MAFCQNCGAVMQDGAKFCASCGGAGAAQPGQQPPPQNYAAGPGAQASGNNDTLMGVLAYIGLLVLIPIFAEKESRFVRFHANQGLVLCIAAVAYSIVVGILSAILWAISWQVALTVSGILWFLCLIFLVLAIIGIVNVVNGKQKPLPVIGGFTILK